MMGARFRAQQSQTEPTQVGETSTRAHLGNNAYAIHRLAFWGRDFVNGMES